MFFSIGPGYRAERGLVLERAEFGERDFAVGVGIRRVAAEQAGFLRHGMLGGVLGMVLHLNGLRVVRQDGSGLSKGSGGAEKAEKRDGDDCGLQS